MVRWFLPHAMYNVTRMNDSAPQYPLRVFYDGQCPLCIRAMKRHQRHDVNHLLRAINIAAPDFNATDYGLNPQRVQAVLHVQASDGRIFTAMDALVCIWNALPVRADRQVLITLLQIQLLRNWADRVYRFIAKNRQRLSGLCASGRCGLPGPIQ